MPAARAVQPFAVRLELHPSPTARRADTPDNLALCCGHCNRHKGPNLAGIDPVDGQMTRLSHPRTDVWAVYFRSHGATPVGLTPIGRATLGVLAMNDELQRSIRQALIDEDVLE